MKKTNSFSAIRYTTKLRLNTILKAPGQAIKVFVPVEHFTHENPVISQQTVYGGRPYSFKSDLVAICCHMGILFPGEKPKKNSTDILLTAPNAPLFNRGEPTSEEHRKIEDDFRFYGVVLSLIAVPAPTDFYSSVRGYCISSQSIKDTNPVALDVLDYSFISEFEPMPELVEDPISIRTEEDETSFFKPIDEDDLLTYQYSRSLFYSDKEGYLFRDFKVLMFTDDDIILQFKWKRNNLCLIEKKLQTNEENTILTGVRFKDIHFLEKGIQVTDKLNVNLVKVVLQPPDGASIE